MEVDGDGGIFGGRYEVPARFQCEELIRLLLARKYWSFNFGSLENVINEVLKSC